ncbi:MAG: hypothetical protein KC561_08195, partial [Myxococcales bacterium]|nr:hypothetical protein [Myxococcales bacterium]
MNDAKAIRGRLSASLRSGEKISSIQPELVARGRWFHGDWPEGLRAGLIEPRSGYQFRPENVTLASLLASRTHSRVLELGCGTGSLLLLASYFFPAAQVLGVELQGELVDCLGRS